ncbi:MAG: calcium-translocating P-type ATPase, PMCA-type [Muribaculaceae bacterium]|nr:calcium-translocating P-type ATPase, PMCA-type [Muribaculaceae bacterium]
MEHSHFKGLSDNEVLESRSKYGENVFTPPPKPSVWLLFIEKFQDPLIKILLVALLLSIGISFYEAFALNEGFTVFFEPLGILIAILLATVIGFALELNANKKFEMLNQVNDEILIKVIRNGNITEVYRKDIVVGDIVLVGTGEEIPADGEIIDSVSLSINESTLTGEPVIKKSHKPEDAKSDATYPTNHALRGTTVTEGHATLKIFNVGDATEYGKVYVAAQIDNGVKTPLSIQFDRLGKLISYASYIIGALIIIGRTLIYDYDNTFDTVSFIDYSLSSIMLAVTLIVVSVPEGLPMSVTLSLALSMRRMLATNNLVRKMHACETMGATTIICTDKTGTLTQNQMSIYDAMFFDLKEKELTNDNASKIISEGIACNTTAFLDLNADKVKALGNPTEGALLLWLHANDKDYLNIRENCNIIDQLPFSTERKYMATVVESENKGERIVYVKGAPEILMNICNSISGNITNDEINSRLAEYQSKAMRTLGFAYSIIPDNCVAFVDGKLAVDNLIFIGIVAISDPVRSDVPESIKECINAGIDVKIITGDTPGTAKEIGRQVGLWDKNCNDCNIISGPDFEALSDEEAFNRVKSIKIMSRARPSDKSRMVNLLQRHNDVVAVTGDGTNDAPALNAAQVGLSMGDGTSVAKEASDITIMDNSFSSITRAVMWGRSLYQNIQRFILFQLTVNVVACLIVVIGAFSSQESPITVTQMLWVNLIMDTFAALALASLPPSEEVMQRKPRSAKDFIINKSMQWFIIGTGVIFVLFLFGLLQYLRQCPINCISEFSVAQYLSLYFDFHYTVKDVLTPYDLTLFFTTFVFLQFWNLFNAKSFMSGHSSLWNMRESKVFFSTLLVIVGGQFIIVYAGGKMFNVVPLEISDFMYIFAGTSIVFWIGELVHLIKRLYLSR